MVTIRRADRADLPAAARTYGRAFHDDPVVRWLVPDADEYAAIHERFFEALARRWHASGTLFVTDDVVGVAGWNPPGRPTFEVDVTGVELEHPASRIERFVALRSMFDEHTPTELHWHLNLIATHPDWQRRGIAGALMSEVFEIAGQEGLPCYLETETPGNVAYYRHHGFEVRSEWDVPLGGPHMWGMWRSAR